MDIKNIFKNLALLAVGIIVAILILEGFLRIYNPLPERIKGSKIYLPANTINIIKNTGINKLDPVVTHMRNSLGFRGPELPDSFKNYISIVAIGGSTTECYYLSDDKTWPYLLGENLKKGFDNIWINNAGLSGHSTYGNKILLEDYVLKIKPKYSLFLLGLNDICRDDYGYCFDNSLFRYTIVNTLNYLSEKSEIANSLNNIIRAVKAQRTGFADSNVDLSNIDYMEISNDKVKEELDFHKIYAEKFKKRVLDLINISKENGITPILVTQSMLWGGGVDPETGIDLDSVKIDDQKNGKLYWQILQLYNDQVRQLASDYDVFLVDLANEMPKNSLYYYDGIHYTSEGAKVVADIISSDLTEYFNKMNIK